MRARCNLLALLLSLLNTPLVLAASFASIYGIQQQPVAENTEVGFGSLRLVSLDGSHAILPFTSSASNSIIDSLFVPVGDLVSVLHPKGSIDEGRIGEGCIDPQAQTILIPQVNDENGLTINRLEIGNKSHRQIRVDEFDSVMSAAMNCVGILAVIHKGGQTSFAYATTSAQGVVSKVLWRIQGDAIFNKAESVSDVKVFSERDHFIIYAAINAKHGRRFAIITASGKSVPVPNSQALEAGGRRRLIAGSHGYLLQHDGPIFEVPKTYTVTDQSLRVLGTMNLDSLATPLNRHSTMADTYLAVGRQYVDGDARLVATRIALHGSTDQDSGVALRSKELEGVSFGTAILGQVNGRYLVVADGGTLKKIPEGWLVEDRVYAFLIRM